jgi:hypothetical protein
MDGAWHDPSVGGGRRRRAVLHDAPRRSRVTITFGEVRSEGNFFAACGRLRMASSRAKLALVTLGAAGVATVTPELALGRQLAASGAAELLPDLNLAAALGMLTLVRHAGILVAALFAPRACRMAGST